MDVQDLPAGVFDPEMLTMMLDVLDDLSGMVIVDDAAKGRLARRLLVAVRGGERDPVRLRTLALRSLAN